MARFWGRYAFVLLITGICLTGFAADKKSASRQSGKVVGAENESEASGGRLPRYFSGLVDQEQREAIYQVQSKYRKQIQQLEQELAELEREQLAAMEKILTTSQRKELASLRSSGLKKKNSSKRSRKK